MFGLCTRKRKPVRLLSHQDMMEGRWENYWSPCQDRGARVTVTLTSTSFYVSPLVQAGLEIPDLVEMLMPRTIKNKEIILIIWFVISRTNQLVSFAKAQKEGIVTANPCTKTLCKKQNIF